MGQLSTWKPQPRASQMTTWAPWGVGGACRMSSEVCSTGLWGPRGALDGG